MKKYILLLALALMAIRGLTQINLIGAMAGGNGNISIAEWQALDSSSLTVFPGTLQSYLLSSSVYDAWNGNYYLTGETTSGFGLFSFNSITNQQGINPFSAFSNITEIDMSTARIYTLTMDGPDAIRVNEYDIATGNTILLGVVVEPGLQGIVVDATGFDSNHGILYYVGLAGNGDLALYGMHVRDQIFSYTRIPLITPSNSINLTCINYDNVNDRLFGMMSVYDSGWVISVNTVVEIDYLSGTVSELGDLTGFTGYLAGSSSFDQLSGSFLLVGVDTSYDMKMIVFSTVDSTFVTGFIPDNVSEIVCDNYTFARNAYTNTSNAIQSSRPGKLNIYPVPAREYLTVELPAPSPLRITDSQGRVVYTHPAGSLRPDVSLTGFPAGVYVIESLNPDHRLRSLFVKSE